VPFTPIRLLILIDDQKGYCGRLVPRMTEMLEDRAFQVDVHRIQDGPVDITPYRGMIIGSPASGISIKGGAPTPALEAYVREMPDLDELQIALFIVFEVHPASSMDRMKGMIFDKGAELVTTYEYGLFRLDVEDHTIAAECMVRIR
jgi:hypothetical protein